MTDDVITPMSDVMHVGNQTGWETEERSGDDARHGYLFDLDGTLVNTHESNTCAYMQALSEVLPERNIDRALLREHIAAGENYRAFLPVVCPGISDSKMAEISAHKAACYADFISRATLNNALVDDARRWKARPGAVMVLVTTAKRVNAERVLSYFGLNDLFDFKVFGDGIGRLKPAPDIYLRALGEAGLQPDQAEAFEDSQAGLDAARAAGVAVTHVTWVVDK